MYKPASTFFFSVLKKARKMVGYEEHVKEELSLVVPHADPAMLEIDRLQNQLKGSYHIFLVLLSFMHHYFILLLVFQFLEHQRNFRRCVFLCLVIYSLRS